MKRSFTLCGLLWGAAFLLASGAPYKPSSASQTRILAEWKQVCKEGLALGDVGRSSNGTEPLRFHMSSGNMWAWHFTFLGPKGTPYEGGLYHGALTLPPEYPLKPPSVKLLTPNGRFKPNTEICLSASNYHPELWQPTWTVQTIVKALTAHIADGSPALEIGAITTTPTEKRRLAKASRGWSCQSCGCRHRTFDERVFPLPPGVARAVTSSATGQATDAPSAAREGDTLGEAVAAAAARLAAAERSRKGGRTAAQRLAYARAGRLPAANRRSAYGLGTRRVIRNFVRVAMLVLFAALFLKQASAGGLPFP